MKSSLFATLTISTLLLSIGCGRGLNDSTTAIENNKFSETPAISIVQQVPTPGLVASGSSATTSAFSFTPTVGNRIVVAVWTWAGSAPSISSVTDNKGNTYSLVTSQVGSGGATIICAIYSAPVTVTGSGFQVTATVSPGTSSIDLVAVEVANLATTPLDQTTSNTSGSNVTSGSSGTTSTTTYGREVAFGIIVTDAAGTVSAGSGTSIYMDNGSTYTTGQFVYKLVSGIGTQSFGWTFASARYASVIATFKGL